MIEQLNEPQRQAVTLPACHALVLAGAGSGKTRVLTTRMAWLIQTGQTSPFGILAVTFTNKAAREMISRVTAMLPIDPRGMWIGTFHGLCNRMLRAHHRDAGLPQAFQILDTADQLAAIKRVLKAAGIDDEKYPPRDVQRFINGSKEEGLRPNDIEAYDSFRRRMIEIYSLYEAQCQREGVVDFAELLLRAYELLQRNEPVRTHYQRRFRHILVDEFQDTNTLQYKWLTLLAGAGASLGAHAGVSAGTSAGATPSASIFAVGDDDQSIYAFRGANVGNMSDFERDYAQGTVIRLEQNYRSFGHILNAANALIQHNKGRLGKELWTDQGEGEMIRVVEQPTDYAEAQWLVDELRGLVSDGVNRQQIAILYRSNAQSRVIEHALFTAGVPYRVYGGLRFFERQEIKHALAYLRLIANLDDDTSWMRVVNFPPRGIGARTLEQLVDQARAYDTSLAQAVARVAGKGGSNLAQFLQLIQRLATETHHLSLPDMVSHVLEHSGLLAHYQTEKEGADRIENLNELVTAAAVFASEDGMEGLPAGEVVVREMVISDDNETAPVTDGLSPLAAFLSHASLEAGDNQAQAGQDAVQLMTIHSAKGLEFDAVFLTGLEEGLFPHENAILDPSGLEEERRLMYVAITRARKRLYMSLSQSRMLHGQTRYAMRSRFLDEIPDAHLKWLTPKFGQTASHFGMGQSFADQSNDWLGERSSSGMKYPASPSRSASARPDTARYCSVARPGLPTRSSSSGVMVGSQVFRIGQGVRHGRFGEGTIIGLSGQGLDAQAQIQFRDVGTKTLALGVAKLELTG